MIGALWTGISGLASHQTALDNESHNISNVKSTQKRIKSKVSLQLVTALKLLSFSWTIYEVWHTKPFIPIEHKLNKVSFVTRKTHVDISSFGQEETRMISCSPFSILILTTNTGWGLVRILNCACVSLYSFILLFIFLFFFSF